MVGGDCYVGKQLNMDENNELNLEEGSTNISLEDFYTMLYVLLRQSQEIKPGSQLSFPLQAFKNLPKKLEIEVERRHGRVFIWIPGKAKDRKKPGKIIVPKNNIITLN